MTHPRRVAFADQANTTAVKIITTSATPHTKGTWVQMFTAAEVAFDIFSIYVYASDVAVSNTDTRALLDIGADPAAGTAYSVVIPDFLIGFMTDQFALAGNMAILPCYIPAGSTIAIRHQSAQASNTAEMGLVLYGGIAADNPFPHRGLVVPYGVTVSTSDGVSPANAGADTEGAWVELVASTTHPHRGLTVGIQQSGTITSGAGFFIDIGIGAAASEVPIIEDIWCFMTTADDLNIMTHGRDVWQPIPEGSRLAVRAQGDSTNRQSDVAVAVYGWG